MQQNNHFEKLRFRQSVTLSKRIYDMMDGGKKIFSQEGIAEALVSIMIPDIFPQDLLHVPPTDILRFREKRKDERNQFLNAIKTLRNELAQADAPEVIEAIINDEKKKIDSAANEYRKSMDILRVAKFGGILTTVITVAADVLGYCSNFPDLYKGAIESSGLWAGILTGILRKE